MAGHCNTCGLPFVFEELSYHTPYCHTTELHDTQLTTAENNLKKATTSTCTSISSLKQPAKDNFKINGTVFTSSSILEDNHKKAIVSPSSTTKEHVKKKRRRRCQKCAGCTAPDCGKCAFCLDMVKFGGQGIRRQCCKERNCLELSGNVRAFS
ncbi:PREDICTED: lysine-specific demethylase 2A-like [Amphimedon queenslandica]|uniref:CXXC-type domain-containing protein n=1 Tax=Amphimedon queenslandica TaxID=400682 RepID=A0AAN0JUS8_AMPQE|nr:PREDICTED: lysine-specific demethylase 2A-like [Amphimedon queenslandica]|eukprot:XP_019860626.1 PREDICTED: lysine-specific demethylase 2A-like [Amphimedon queenslandica]